MRHRSTQHTTIATWHVDCLVGSIPITRVRVVKRVDIMDTRITELQQHLGVTAGAAADDVQAKRDEESRAQQAALEQLADRISAARSVF